MTDRPRTEAAMQAADTLAAAELGAVRTLVGFDGFVDEIIHVVDRRASMAADDFRRIETIAAFSARCAAASGRSANIEFSVREVRFGGNGPLMAGGLGQLGLAVTYIGAVGREDAPTELDPIFAPFAARCARVVPICPPAHTDALEFNDGKLMFGKPANVQGSTWPRILEVVGLDEITEIVRASSAIGIVNWTLAGGAQGIWVGLREDVLSKLDPEDRPPIMIDLSDPAKRTDEDLRSALDELSRLNSVTPVTLGLNLAESQRIADLIGVDAYANAGNASEHAVIRDASAALRSALGLGTLVIHKHAGAAAADADGDAWFDAPYTRTPRISTGAGDHFNAGFATGRLLGLPLDASLAMACGLSGAYVRDGQSPTRDRLVQFLRDLPLPE